MKMAKNLVLYGYSGFYHCQRNRLQSAIEGLENVEIVLMEDATVGTSKTETETPYTPLIRANVPLYGLSEDLKARGMDPENLAGGITPIDYDKLIDLIETSERIISWL